MKFPGDWRIYDNRATRYNGNEEVDKKTVGQGEMYMYHSAKDYGGLVKILNNQGTDGINVEFLEDSPIRGSRFQEIFYINDVNSKLYEPLPKRGGKRTRRNRKLRKVKKSRRKHTRRN